MQEIGSEFQLNSCEIGKNPYFTLMPGQRKFVLSGRTALSYIADDLLLKRKIKNIAMPAYCCSSMVEPFISKEIQIHFYEKDSFAEVLERSDAVLLLDYFGFSSPWTLQSAKLCKSRGVPLIVDATQTAFSRFETYELCDYLVCSYRKWTDSLCAAVYCRDGFGIPFSCEKATEYISLWRQASREKKAYLETGRGEKQQFLGHYAAANHLLGEKHDRLATDLEEVQKLEHISSDFLRRRRRENAKYLIEEIQKTMGDKVKLLFSQLEEEDCPLFLPVLLPEEERRNIRQKLIEEQVYCPIHWPIDKNYPYMETTLHWQELSLVCDQRYAPVDMQRQIKVLKQAIYGDE